jgi:hypothetical protein
VSSTAVLGILGVLDMLDVLGILVMLDAGDQSYSYSLPDRSLPRAHNPAGTGSQGACRGWSAGRGRPGTGLGFRATGMLVFDSALAGMILDGIFALSHRAMVTPVTVAPRTTGASD